MSEQPVLFQGGLSGRVFVATKWHWDSDGRQIADEKFDVTESFEDVANERPGYPKCLLNREQLDDLNELTDDPDWDKSQQWDAYLILCAIIGKEPVQ